MEDGYGNAFKWPLCAVKGCFNGAKLGESDKCYPHTPGLSMAKCECGAKAVGSNVHAEYCEVATDE